MREILIVATVSLIVSAVYNKIAAVHTLNVMNGCKEVDANKVSRRIQELLSEQISKVQNLPE